jgi:retinol dehydrogenase 14
MFKDCVCLPIAIASVFSVFCEDTAREIQASIANSVAIAKQLDLASLRSVRQFCKQILLEEPRIDVLINNAGVFQCPYMKTEDGFEMQMGVHHFGHFLLTTLLMDRIKSSAPSRIVIVSSSLSKRGCINFDDINSENKYSKSKAYSDSKLANLLFAQELSRRLQDSEVDVFPLHPGVVMTNIGKYIVSDFVLKNLGLLLVLLGLRDANEGCQSLVYCSVAKELKGKSGQYISQSCKPCPYPSNALDYEAAQRLWKLSEQLTNSA